MAGLPWIPLAVDFPDSRKAVALGVALQNPLAWAYVVRLWTWCAKNAQDGRVEGPDAVTVVEHAAGWNGSPGALVEAASLPHIALLDATEKGFSVHDWSDHCGAHVEKREKDRLRMRRARKKNRSRTLREPSAHVPGERERERETEKKLQAPPLACAREAGAADRQAVLNGRDEVLSQKYPRTAALLGALEAVKCPAAWPKEPDTRAAVESAIGDQQLAALVERVSVAIAESGKPWLGHHIPAITGRAPTQKNKPAANVNAPAPIGTNWGGPPPF